MFLAPFQCCCEAKGNSKSYDPSSRAPLPISQFASEKSRSAGRRKVRQMWMRWVVESEDKESKSRQQEKYKRARARAYSESEGLRRIDKTARVSATAINRTIISYLPSLLVREKWHGSSNQPGVRPFFARAQKHQATFTPRPKFTRKARCHACQSGDLTRAARPAINLQGLNVAHPLVGNSGRPASNPPEPLRTAQRGKERGSSRPSTSRLSFRFIGSHALVPGPGGRDVFGKTALLCATFPHRV